MEVAHEVGAYLHDVEAHEVGDYLVAEQARVDAEAERVAQEADRVARPSTAPRTTNGEVGECTGFAIPAYIIQRESGGSSVAANPSGAYGCAQTLLGHYNSGGSCSGLDPYTIEGQRQCVWILSDGGTNLAPWAETR
jgi:hypothetical protein